MMKNLNRTAAEVLNRGCACRTLDQSLLEAQLERDPLLHGLFQNILISRPHLFSSTAVFLSSDQYKEMTELIAAIEEVVQSLAYKNLTLRGLDTAVIKDFGPKGVFMGYDFHIGDEGPQLIEINTNAGGALLNLELARAQEQCDFNKVPAKDILNLEQTQKKFFEMFKKEWSLQNSDKELNLIAIVDDGPEKQYLFPEFQLFQRLFEGHGVKAVIADPQDIELNKGELWLKGEKVDMIYNRLTDFYLDDDSHQKIKEAFVAGKVVLTPNPYHHALYANKINLVTLTDEIELNKLNVQSSTILKLLKGIPKTERVYTQKSEDLWSRRKDLFFKPLKGFGSKATYRGDKITRKVWEKIIQEDYVAQKIIPPSQRLVQVDDTKTDLKIDIRAYVYEGQIQLLASRLYAGQTTNFRTAGGGFAPVFVIE